MQLRKIFIGGTFLLFALLLSIGLRAEILATEPQVSVDKRPDLIIYSGITMIHPLKVLADAFEKEHHVNIQINQGASGFLFETINKRRSGDIYFPGSDSYRKLGEKDGIITDHVFVGFNRVALVVPKGNPKKLTNDLNQLTRPDLSVVLSSPTSGAIGKAGDKILKQAGIAQKVYKNVTYFTTDSHRLAYALKSGQADVVINWYAVTKWPENRNFMTAIPLAPKNQTIKKLELNLLSFSKHPKLAKQFMHYAASREGVKVFHQYGFFTDQEYHAQLQKLDKLKEKQNE